MNSQTPEHPISGPVACAQPRESIPNSALAQQADTDTPHPSRAPSSLAQTMQQRVYAMAEQASGTSQPNQTGIPDRIKQDFENRSGLSFDDVRVHYNSDKPAKFNAEAYAQGNEIHIAPGEERSLPHELTHIVQQRYGLVSETAKIDGVPVNLDSHLEQQADSASFPANGAASHAPHPAIVQLSRRLARMGQNPANKDDPNAEFQPDPEPQVTRNRRQGQAFEDECEKQLQNRGITYQKQQRVKFDQSSLTPVQLSIIASFAYQYGVDSDGMKNYTRIYDFYDPNAHCAYEMKSGNANYSHEQACFDSLVMSGLPCVDSQDNPITIGHIKPVFERNLKKH